METIIVAVACNLVALLILVSGVLSTINSGIRVAGLKLFFTIVSGVGAYFLTPVVSNIVLGITFSESVTLGSLLMSKGIYLGSINSVIFLVIFIAFYLCGTIFSNIGKHLLIKGVREKSVNSAKLKRAKSINAKAERIAKKAEWKALKSEYKSGLSWWHRLISISLGAISSIIIIFVILNAFGFISKDIVAADPSKEFLNEGYNYTINGVIEDNIDFDFDGWLIGISEGISK